MFAITQPAVWIVRLEAQARPDLSRARSVVYRHGCLPPALMSGNAIMRKPASVASHCFQVPRTRIWVAPGGAQPAKLVVNCTREIPTTR
jgi:hypothetical protein